MKVSDMFPSNWLKADDLPDDGLILTITGVQYVRIGEDEKPAMAFKETKLTGDKALILNKTNADAITQAIKSDDTDDWIGKQIRIYPAETSFQGKMVPCIRVALRGPKAANGAAASAKPSGRGRPGVPDYDELPPSDPLNADDVPF